MKGCLAYDCFGAGQKATRLFPQNVNWMTHPNQAYEIFSVFHILFQLHQYLWYLLEAMKIVQDESTIREIELLMDENQRVTGLDPKRLIEFDLGVYKSRVDGILKEVILRNHPNRYKETKNKDYLGKNFKGINLDNSDFTMSLLIGANLEGCKLDGANFLGADLRDAIIKNTNLSESLFLTQMQINSAIGNKQTILPIRLVRPTSWDDQ
ncbi:MAG: pentapeptide repeat-containing protein [Erysipelotrichaceae bacterium]